LGDIELLLFKRKEKSKISGNIFFYNLGASWKSNKIKNPGNANKNHGIPKKISFLFCSVFQVFCFEFGVFDCVVHNFLFGFPSLRKKNQKKVIVWIS
jgi:hypothetical protein